MERLNPYIRVSGGYKGEDLDEIYKDTNPQLTNNRKKRVEGTFKSLKDLWGRKDTPPDGRQNDKKAA